jgi:hypothetical protein
MVTEEEEKKEKKDKAQNDSWQISCHPRRVRHYNLSCRSGALVHA